MRVAIAQPTYLGWAGYFSLLAQADVFVLLDTVAVSRQSWQTRNRVQFPDGRDVWLSIPIRSELGQRLDTVEIDNSRGWQRKHWATIQACYTHAPYWDGFDWLKDYYDCKDFDLLAEWTISLIRQLAGVLGIRTRIIRARGLEPLPDGKIERLEAILEHLGATAYLTSPGATYLRSRTHVGPARIRWHNYVPVIYERGGRPCDPYLSVVDSLAWNGAAKTAELLRAPSEAPA